ncbi:odorant receptor 85c-like isoform X2 [Choristoneura fumiferana]
MEAEFKPFRETYKTITFNMIVGQLYPNPRMDRRRAICIALLWLSVAPVISMVMLDMYHSWKRRDFVNIIRHATVVGPLNLVLLKMLLLYIRRAEVYQIIKIIDSDHSKCNNLPEEHKSIARKGIKDSKFYSEYCWTWVVRSCVMTFPMTAVILNIYNYMFMSDPVLYMVHDTEKPFSEPEDRFTSPFFEFMFVYMTYCSFLFVLSFTGFDAFFGVTINHICLKIALLCKEFEDAMLENDSVAIFNKMVDVIKQHNEVFRMVDLVQQIFNIWLGIILVATVVQICNCMYQVIEGYGIDPRYLMFVLATCIHIHMPCRYAAKLQAATADVATSVYCSGWERTGDLRARRTVVFMIARAQVPINITAFNMVNFDMELFVSILQKSYSLFTLLRP